MSPSPPAPPAPTSARTPRHSTACHPTCRPASSWASRSARRPKPSGPGPRRRTTGASGPASPLTPSPTRDRRSGLPGSPPWRGSPPRGSRSSPSAALAPPPPDRSPAPAPPGSRWLRPCGVLATRPRRRTRCAPHFLDPLDGGQVLGVGGREDVLAVALRHEIQERHVRRVEGRGETGPAGLGDRARWEPGVEIRVIGRAYREVLLPHPLQPAPVGVAHGRVGLEPHP